MSAGHSYDTRRDGPLAATSPLEFSSDRPAPPDPAFVELIRSPRTLDSGRTLRVDSTPDGTDRVTIRGTNGEVELRVTLTADGPVLHFQAADISLEAAGRVSVRCDEFGVVAEKGIRHLTDGDLVQTVAGDATLLVKGDLVAAARELHLGSTRGDVRIRANDDVLLNGERVKLNC